MQFSTEKYETTPLLNEHLICIIIWYIRKLITWTYLHRNIMINSGNMLLETHFDNDPGGIWNFTANFNVSSLNIYGNIFTLTFTSLFAGLYKKIDYQKFWYIDISIIGIFWITSNEFFMIIWLPCGVKFQVEKISKLSSASMDNFIW